MKDLERYAFGYGKLKENLNIPIDANFKTMIDEIKQTFDFNAWVRDLIKANIQEVVDLCRSQNQQKL